MRIMIIFIYSTSQSVLIYNIQQQFTNIYFYYYYYYYTATPHTFTCLCSYILFWNTHETNVLSSLTLQQL